MKLTKTPHGTIFEFSNQFSVNRISKNDRRLNSHLKRKYELIKNLHLDKFAKKKSWFRVMDYHWGEKYSQLSEIDQKRIDESIKLTLNDLKLEQLIVYDLLPKEYLEDYKNHYIKFTKIFKATSPFTRTKKNIVDSFQSMDNSTVTGSWYNIDCFDIKENTSLSSYFNRISLSSIGLSESFYIIKYTLNITDYANQQLEQILKRVVYKESICISCDKWWKRKSFAGCTLYDLRSDAKRYAIEDFILELKAKFFKEIKKHIFSKFFNWDNIPPSVEIYSSNTLSTQKESIFELVSRNGSLTVDYQEKENIYFFPYRIERRRENLNNTKIVLDSKLFENDHGLYPFLKYDDLLCTQFAEYFVLTALNLPIANIIYDSQRKINKNVYSKAKLNSLINLKIEIEKKLYFYKRLYKELNKMIEFKTKKNRKIKTYTEEFTNEYKKIHNEDSPYGFPLEYNRCFYSIETQYELIQSIFSHFDENSKLIESRYNYGIIKWTFIIGLLTLIATGLLANDSWIILKLWEWLKTLF